MKKALSLILALCMLLAAVPLRAQAAALTGRAAVENAEPQSLPGDLETNGAYKLTYTKNGPGKVTLYAGSADAYENVYVMIDPDPGYVVDAAVEFYYYYHKASLTYVGNNMYVVNMSDGDCNVVVNFVPASGDNHKVNLNVWNGGSVTLNQQQAKYDESVIMEIHTNRGYEFAGIDAYTASGAQVSLYDVSSDDVTIVEMFMPNEDVNVEVAFERVGNPFVDVKEKDFFYDPVMWAVDNGITNGTDATHFSPLANCNRAQVVTFLWRAWGCPKPQSSNNPFTDVKKGTFYYDAVLWAVENGITNGATATTFNPDGVCNRAQVVTFLWRSLGQPKPKSTANPFTDVPGGTWYTDAVLWALEKKVTTGATATTFNPNGNCQRAHVVTFLYRAVQSQN